MTTLSVTIGGNDVSSDVISLTTEQDICRVAQTFEVALDPTSSGSFDPWDDVVIAINGTNRLTGYVNEVVKGRVPTEFVVRGMDKMKLALEMFVPNAWTATDYLSADVEVIGEEQDAGWWIDFWLGEAGITSSGSVETGYTVPVDEENPLVWTYTAVSDIILECLGYAGGGYTVIVDGSGTAQIAEKAIGGGTTHTLNDSNILAFSRSEDDSWLRDRAVVFGATSGSAPIVVEKPDDPAGTTKALALSSDLIKTEARAGEIAEAILDFFDETLDIKRCEIVGDESIWLGDAASVSDSWTGYSGTGLITSIETSVDDRGFRQLVSVDEKCGFVWGWQKGYFHMIHGDAGESKVYFSTGTLTATGITDFSPYTIDNTLDFDMLPGGVFDIWRDGSNVYAAWVTAPSANRALINFSKSDNDGVTWSAVQTLLDSDDYAFNDLYSLRIRGDTEGRLFVCFHTTGGLNEVQLLRSIDSGTTWVGPETIDSDSTAWFVTDMVIDSSDNIYVFFGQAIGGPPMYKCRKSTDHGVSWGSAILASPGVTIIRLAPLDVNIDSDDGIHVIGIGYDGSNNEVFHWLSSDGGVSFDSPSQVSDVYAQASSSGGARFCINGSDLYCVWMDSSGNLRYSSSSDNGASWSASIIVASSPNMGLIGANACVYGNGVILYQYFEETANECRALTSSDGASWTESVTFSFLGSAQGACYFR